MSAGTADHCVTKAFPPDDSSMNTNALSMITNVVTTRKRVGASRIDCVVRRGMRSRGCHVFLGGIVVLGFASSRINRRRDRFEIWTGHE
jgi:hypothetical protein